MTKGALALALMAAALALMLVMFRQASGYVSTIEVAMFRQTREVAGVVR